MKAINNFFSPALDILTYLLRIIIITIDILYALVVLFSGLGIKGLLTPYIAVYITLVVDIYYSLILLY